MTMEYILTFSCPDQAGISLQVANFIFDAGGNVTESQQFHDSDTEMFFMRVKFLTPKISLDDLQKRFSSIAQNLKAKWKICNTKDKKKVLLMVSKFDHCLGDLLYRWRLGELNMDVVGIVSNHPQSALNLTTMNGIPYTHLPITKKTKPQQEAQIKAIVEETGADLIVLARYMQILSDDMCGFLSGRCINIHHSFLPGFKGARPYHQAYNRGVKMIGATAHFVTQDLDEGPIITQDVQSITHEDKPADLIRKGRDVERRVLARAVRMYINDKVIMNGSKTIVF